MKNKLFFFVAVVLLLSLSGCSSYYYSILSSNDRVGIRSDLGDFVQETDTVVVSYSFNGENAPVSIIIYNKLDEPLFVDWTRSALIIDDIATVYQDKKVLVEGETESVSHGESYRWNSRITENVATSRGSFAGSVFLPKGVDFIPPKSKIENIPLNLPGIPFDKILKEEYVKENIMTNDLSMVSVRTKEFTESDSPLCFRSYLTLYTDDHNGKQRKYMFFERNFYISKLIKAGNVPPSDFSEQQQLSGDFSYARKVKGAGVGIAVGAVALGVASVVVGVALGPGDESFNIEF